MMMTIEVGSYVGSQRVLREGKRFLHRGNICEKVGEKKAQTFLLSLFYLPFLAFSITASELGF